MSNINITRNRLINEDDNYHEYIFENINYSFINAIRRTILSDIPVYVFNGFPNLLRGKNKNEKKKVVENIKIKKNTTRLNNEIIKQRLTCIPIYLPVTKSLDYKNLIFKLDTTNIEFEEDIIPTVKYITTKHFRIFESDMGEGKDADDSLHNLDLTKEKKQTDEFNPLKPFKTEDGKEHHILITRLNPAISDQIPVEELILTCKLSIHTAKENGCFNAVSCCSYSYYPNEEKQEEEWEKYKNAQANKTPSINLNDDKDKTNWLNLNGKRYYIPDKFKFRVESLGIYTCDKLIEKAILIIKTKLDKFREAIANYTNLTNPKYKYICNKSLINVPYAYDITLTNEDYTIGKILEYVLHKNMTEYELGYVGFMKKHPHDNYSIIRIILNSESLSTDDKIKIKAQKVKIKTIILNAYEECIKILDDININFD